MSTAPERAAAPPASPVGLSYRPALDGLRALAALWVLAYHCWIRTGAGPLDGLGPLGPVVKHGALGVEVFFVLSGCVLALGLLERGDAGRRWWPFVVRRAARLLPAVWVVLLAAIATASLHVADPGVVRRALTPESIVANGTLLGGLGRLIPGYEGAIGFGVDPVIWSLTPELLFSLAIVLILPLIARRPVVAIGLLLAAGVALRAVEPSLRVLSVASPLLTAFPIGVAVAVIAHRRPRAQPSAPLVASGALLLFAFVFAQSGGAASELKDDFARSLWQPVLVAVASGLLCLGLAPESSRGLGARIPALLGRWSYGIYLWHFPIIGLLVWSAGLPADGSARSVALAFLVTVPLSVAAGAASYRWVEMPARRWATAWRQADGPNRSVRIADGS